MKNQRLLSILICILFINISTQFPVYGKDVWRRVNTKNFTLIGNASEGRIKKVGIKLEQFRESIKRLVPSLSANSPIETTVIVFKDEKSFNPYKPINANGDVTDWVAGYFQAGFDVNYIAITFENEGSDPYQTIFHEYTHNLIDYNFGRKNIPTWFSEGMSEYYDQFDVRKDRIVKLGGRNKNHLELLEDNNLIPLEKLFQIDYDNLRGQDQVNANLFYAQSWALIHYLMSDSNGQRKPQLDKFIQLLLKNTELKQAFDEAFEMSYSGLEIRLADHIKTKRINASITEFEDSLTKDMSLITSAFSEAEVQANLGDLLYQREKLDDAEKHLKRAIGLDPNLSLANSTLGLINFKNNKLEDANKYFKLASRSNDANYLTFYRHAYFLSREVMTFKSFVSSYSDERALEMRNLLARSIDLNPGFPESYRLLGFINLVRNEKFDEGLEFLQKALKISPNNQIYSIHLAQLYLRKNDLKNANIIAESVVNNTNDNEIKERALNIIENIDSIEKQIAKANEIDELFGVKNNQTSPTNRPKALTEEDLEKNRKQSMNEAISEVLRKPEVGEARIVGQISDVNCFSNRIIIKVNSDNQTKVLQTKNFEVLLLRTYTDEMRGAEFGCGENKKNISAVLIYKPMQKQSDILGDVVSIEFVPSNFVLSNGFD